MPWLVRSICPVRATEAWLTREGLTAELVPLSSSAELAKRAKQTPEQLRKGENYAEQRDVVDAMAKQHGNAMVCMLLPKAHGGFARGVLQAR